MATGPFEAKQMSAETCVFMCSALQRVIVEPRKNSLFFSEAIIGVIINLSKIMFATTGTLGL